MKDKKFLDLLLITTILLGACSTPVPTNNTNPLDTNNKGTLIKFNPKVNLPSTISDVKKEQFVKDKLGDEIVKGELLAIVKEQKELDDILTLSNGIVTGGNKVIGLAEILIPEGKDPEEVAEMLVSKGYHVTPNFHEGEDSVKDKSFSVLNTGDPFWSDNEQTWWLNYVNMNQAWQMAEPVNIKIGAVEFDSQKQDDLNFAQIGESSGAKPGHGNHVTGIINAIANNNIGITGVMQGKADFTLYITSGDLEHTSIIIQQAADKGIKVFNMSLGPVYKDPTTDEEMQKRANFSAEVYKPVMDYAKSKGMLITGSAGNGILNQEGQFSRDIPAKFNIPGGLSLLSDNILCVANIQEDGTKNASSNFGEAVNIAAPGTRIYAPIGNGEFGFKTGTSMAAPLVAGIAGLIWSKYPNLNYLQVKEAIINSATRRVPQHNFPVVDAAAAIQYAAKFAGGNSK